MEYYKKILKKIAHFQVRNPKTTIVLLLLFTLAIYGGVSQVRTVAALEQMMPKNVPEIKAFNTLRDNQMGQDMIAIVISVDKDSADPLAIQDITDKRVYEYILHIQEGISQQPDILNVYNYATILANHNSPDATQSDQKSYSAALKEHEKEISEFINSDKSTTIIIATTDVSADDPRMNLLATKIEQTVDSAGHPPGTKIRFTGTPVIQQKLGELISQDRQNTKWISTAFVFIITLLLFETFTSALVPIIVVTISVTWLYGTMGYTDLPISTLAGGVGAMVIGIGIDFAIHILNKFKYERKKGNTIKLAVEKAVVDTGTALTATSITTVAAFLAFLYGTMPEMGRFGILMAIGIGYALVFSVFGLPALLVIEEQIIYRIRKKLHFGVEGEFSLHQKNE